MAHLQHASANRITQLLAYETPIYPTHGFGSFCAATSTSGTSSTIKDEKSGNPALLLSPADFVAQTLAGLDAFPAYYQHMGPANLAGAGPIDLSELPRLTSEELLKAIAGPDWVIDLRSKDFWAQGHLQGTLNF